MPVSRRRKKKRPANTNAAPSSIAPRPLDVPPSPTWWAPVMVTLMIIGLIWVVITYLMAGAWPLPIGNWNLAIGIGLMLIGFMMTLRWR